MRLTMTDDKNINRIKLSAKRFAAKMRRTSFSVWWLLFVNIAFSSDIVFQDSDAIETCIDRVSGKHGRCRLVADCGEKVLRNLGHRPTICRYNGYDPVVCCPEDAHPPADIIGFVPYNETCRVDGTGEAGQIKPKQFCLVERTLPPACKYEVCKDLVCCPENVPRTRLIKNCVYEDADQRIREQVSGNFECTVPKTGQPGMYISEKSCSYYAEHKKKNMTIPKVCDWKSCKGTVCCPKTHLKNTECKAHGDSIYDYIKPVGEACVIKETNKAGICISQSKCLSQQRIGHDKAQVCGIDCCTSIVCCPEPDFASIPPYQLACAGYRDTVYQQIKPFKSYLDKSITSMQQCTAVKPAGGVLAHPKQFPHMAVLGYQGELDTEINWACGGTLISNRFVLTAGHCLDSGAFGPAKFVRLGIITLQVDWNDNRGDCPEHFKIIERIPHPKYTRLTVYDDIALLRLERDVIFNADIRPACLGDMRTFDDKVSFQAMGFGRTGHDQDRTERLIYVYLKEFKHPECNASFASSINRKFKLGVIDETQICAGSRNSIQDTCPGDSGGPLQVDHPDFYKMAMVVGITSFGRACGFKNVPAIYTRVYPYLSWIEGIVWPT